MERKLIFWLVMMIIVVVTAIFVNEVRE